MVVVGMFLGAALMAGGFAIGHYNAAPAAPEQQGPAEPVQLTVQMANFQFDKNDVEVPVGSTVTWENKDTVYHTVNSNDPAGPLNSGNVNAGQTYQYTFTAAGSYYYHCIPHSAPLAGQTGGQNYSGMVGVVRVTSSGTGGTPAEPALPPALPVEVPEIGRDPTDFPPPITRTTNENVTVNLFTKMVVATMAEGVTYQYWTFNQTVPGPMIRVLVGDTITINLENRDTQMTHSIDLHAVMGPGGGAAVMQVPPGETGTFTFKAMRVGVFIYHCATPPVDYHLANGMYGLVVVEPVGGFPPVDHEFYVVQGDFYTNGKVGEAGHHSFDPDALHLEEPTYVVFNGRVGSLTGDRVLTSTVNDTVRIFIGDAGPNLVSSFHVIGQIFDRVYDQAGMVGPPMENIQTTLVPAGGAAVVEFVTLVPGNYILVDHSISRTIYRGCLGLLTVTGPDAPDIFHTG